MKLFEIFPIDSDTVETIPDREEVIFTLLS